MQILLNWPNFRGHFQHQINIPLVGNSTAQQEKTLSFAKGDLPWMKLMFHSALCIAKGHRFAWSKKNANNQVQAIQEKHQTKQLYFAAWPWKVGLVKTSSILENSIKLLYPLRNQNVICTKSPFKNAQINLVWRMEEKKMKRKIKYSTAVSIMQNHHLHLTRTRIFLTQRYEKWVHKHMNKKIEGGFEDIQMNWCFYTLL